MRPPVACFVKRPRFGLGRSSVAPAKAASNEAATNGYFKPHSPNWWLRALVTAAQAVTIFSCLVFTYFAFKALVLHAAGATSATNPAGWLWRALHWATCDFSSAAAYCTAAAAAAVGMVLMSEADKRLCGKVDKLCGKVDRLGGLPVRAWCAPFCRARRRLTGRARLQGVTSDVTQAVRSVGVAVAPPTDALLLPASAASAAKLRFFLRHRRVPLADDGGPLEGVTGGHLCELTDPEGGRARLLDRGVPPRLLDKAYDALIVIRDA